MQEQIRERKERDTVCSLFVKWNNMQIVTSVLYETFMLPSCW